MTYIATRSSSLSQMLAEIADAVDGGTEELPCRVAAAIGAHVGKCDLLSQIACPSCPNSYIRHLLYADPAGRYAAVALIWRPGQMSPVHAHRTWCALGVHRGVLSEAFYDAPEGDHQPLQTTTVLRKQGATSHGPADPRLIHRIANLGTTEAVSIHVYGAKFERFGQDVNHVF